MKQIVSIILTLLALNSCQNREEKKVERVNEQSEEKELPYSDLILYDHFDNELLLDTISNHFEAQFSPTYIGELRDSIKLTYKPAKIENRTPDWDKYRRPNPKDLGIYIDTTKTIGFSMSIWEYYKKPEYRVGKKSYPVIIENNSTDTLSIGLGDILPMTTEILDSLGQWTEIERPFIYDCGTGLTEFFLPPNQIAITALRQNFGTSKAKFRVKYELDDSAVYSNEINGKIQIE
ncbi:hypothetical protein [Croceimicrobium hydrocarbonivorans]|uniref:Uncharacterized protein n=1 Tax=Croceimicrobium hydrocarbonivorans TaxID=2761580 RepID=A0A7H0VHB5_9FLAO|nr:hypothetical protein [Croceimicrobium hydrocarbonivorans]QNR25113.1 hypothetical protein H4K34_04550 [Croceimicrobium hydrocarbonivorans]